MINFSIPPAARRMAAITAVCAAILVAGETKFWQHDEMSEFERGDAKNLSLRSDGRLFLAPKVTELFDPSTAFLWGLARDSKGVLYAGGGVLGGTKSKLFAIENGNGRLVAEVDGLAVQTIAIDRQDRVYFATSPDGKVFRLSAGGKAEVFYEPKTKYIWALAFSRSGDLFVGTGDEGEIHRVTPDGRGSVFFKTEETHVRCLAFDANDNLVAGTDPSGLVLRVSPRGEGFVLYQAPKREITSIAVAADGSVFAAGAGNKTSGAFVPLPAATPASAPPVGGGITIQTGPPRPVAASTPAAAAPSVTGGSDVYKIQADGYPRRVWSHPLDIVYALALDGSGHALIATGNKGNIYRLESEAVYTLLLHLPPSQVTTLLSTSSGVFATTGNIGKVYQIGPSVEASGTLESEVLDASGFTFWGRLRFQGKRTAGQVKLETRSGNLGRAQKNWSSWMAVSMSSDGTGRIPSPPSRFLQYRLTLTGPVEVSLVEIAYQGKNVAPVVERVETTPSNYKFPAPSNPVLTNNSLTLQPLGKHSASSSTAFSDAGISPTMTYAKGQVGARWLANDENGDTLLFRVEIRGVNETQWKLLKEKIRERYYSWDSTTFPDGEYLVRVTASDEPSNPPDQALTARMESDSFFIDNTPPEISELRATSSGNRLDLRWKAKDAISVIGKAEYSINGGDWRVAEPTTRLSDSLQHEYAVSIERPTGEVTIAVRVSDELDNQAAAKTVVK